MVTTPGFSSLDVDRAQGAGSASAESKAPSLSLTTDGSPGDSAKPGATLIMVTENTATEWSEPSWFRPGVPQRFLKLRCV